MIEPPPMAIVNTLEQWSPGFWNRFFGAIWAGYHRYGEPIQATSWHRSSYRNAELGGHPESQHLVGTAVDWLPADPRLAQAFELVGFQAVLESSHVHIQAFPAGLLRRVGFLEAVGI